MAKQNISIIFNFDTTRIKQSIEKFNKELLKLSMKKFAINNKQVLIEDYTRQSKINELC